MSEQSIGKLLNWPFIVLIIVLMGIGFGIGYLFFNGEDSSITEEMYRELEQRNETLDSLFHIEIKKTDSLSTRIDTLETRRAEDLIIIDGLKQRRNERINNISTMDHDDLFEFFSNH